MTRSLRLSAVSSAHAIAATLAFSGQAQAHQVTAAFAGMERIDEISYSVMLPPGSGNSATKRRTSTGIFNFGKASGPIDFFGVANDRFASFCIDSQDPIGTGNPGIWDVVSLAQAPYEAAGPVGAKKTIDLAKRLGGAITSGVRNYARNLLRSRK